MSNSFLYGVIGFSIGSILTIIGSPFIGPAIVFASIFLGIFNAPRLSSKRLLTGLLTILVGVFLVLIKDKSLSIILISAGLFNILMWGDEKLKKKRP